MRTPGDEIAGLTKVALHKQRDWDSNFDCSASLKPWSFHYGLSLCSIELDLHAKSGTVLGPDISSMSELGLWRQERSEAGVRSTESPAPATPVKNQAPASQRRKWLRLGTAERMFIRTTRRRLNPATQDAPEAALLFTARAAKSQIETCFSSFPGNSFWHSSQDKEKRLQTWANCHLTPSSK